MKARTKFQKRVEELAQDNFSQIKKTKYGSFREQIITQKQKDWMFKNCLEHKAFATKHKAGCLDCGATFPTAMIKNEKVVCPECKTTLKVVHTRHMIDSQECYVAQAVPVAEFQVIRNFYVKAYYKKGKPCEFRVHEILQYWADTKGNTQMYGCVMSGWNHSFSGGFECRINRGSSGYYSGNKWNINPHKYLPGSRFRKEFSRAGISRSKLLKKYHFLEAATIFMNPIGETLYKTKQTQFLSIMRDNPKVIKKLWPSIKICFRNKYEITNARTWIDYIEMLKKYGRDIHSPKYICPKDLHKEHNRYVEKERRERQRQYEIDRIQRLAKQMKESAEMEEDYAKRKAKFIGLEFSNEVYDIRFLNSVKEFAEEGGALRHCIFSREYFKEPSLLFSVRRKNGDRVATVELSIKTWRVLQCRTMYNVVSPESKPIEELIVQNFGIIRDRMKPKKKPVKKKRELELA